MDVTNAGGGDGNDVAQLYLRRNFSSVETPERELKGFFRVHLKAGETKTITFDLPQRELQIWNAEHEWVVEPGAYTLWLEARRRRHSRQGLSFSHNSMSTGVVVAFEPHPATLILLPFFSQTGLLTVAASVAGSGDWNLFPGDLLDIV